jgi:PhoPQ-activated pathogenicity-related protein
MKRILIALLSWSLTITAGAGQTALDQYVAKPDPNYQFNRYHTESGIGYDTYFLKMTSQRWREPHEVDRVLWEHELIIIVPWNLYADGKHSAILLINGGSNGGIPPMETNQALAGVAVSLGSVLAVVNQIPNQPLRFADEADRSRSEDGILAYSMDKYLITGDSEWPVHMAMTKAAVRAMDTVQSFLGTRQRIDDFIVIGGSKRGWTTWLTAAVDPRVKAIAPASIDMLNLRRQFIHHWEAYGSYAPAIRDYVEFNLPCRMETQRGDALLQIIDPYRYRDRYTLPKLILNATGDQFFLPDSSQFYFGALPGPKLLRYTPNTDHSQDVKVILSALVWLREIQDGKTGPQYSWNFAPDGSIRVQTSTQPRRVLLWQASKPSARDFRLESVGPVWTSTEIQENGDGIYVGDVPTPAQGWTALMVELDFTEPGLVSLLGVDQLYTTDVRITPDILPFKGTACAGFAGRPVKTIGLYATAQGRFYLRNSNSGGQSDLSFTYGPVPSGWLPVVGDWDGDGVDTVGLYDQRTAMFYLRNANTAGVADMAVNYGPAANNWLPVVGDWDRDGVDTVGLYQPDRGIFHLRNSNTPGVADIAFFYGPANGSWLPVVGDWDRDGVDTVGLYQPDRGIFHLRNSNTPGVADIAFFYGPANGSWLPLAGNWQ